LTTNIIDTEATKKIDDLTNTIKAHNVKILQRKADTVRIESKTTVINTVGIDTTAKDKL